jgi:hypothetical protein
MKWLIISTIGKNPGDDFIRIGVENVIKLVDKSASGQALDKETPGIFKDIPFDKCIWAGMPVFWSLHNNTSWNVPWWQVMTRGWLSNNKNNFCVLGAGSFQDWKDINRGLQREKMHEEATLLQSRSHIVTVRDPLACNITGVNFDTIVCPAILSTLNKKKTGSIKGCNLMPNGAHYSQFNDIEANIWRDKVKNISQLLLDNNYMFFAHNLIEYDHAIKLGWKDERIIRYNGNPYDMLTHYRNVDKFFGNRVHGCIVSRGVDADVMSCGYDTRQEAVRLSGAKVFLPSEIDLSLFEEWVKNEPVINKFDVTGITDRYSEILEEFMVA